MQTPIQQRYQETMIRKAKERRRAHRQHKRRRYSQLSFFILLLYLGYGALLWLTVKRQ